MISKKDSMQCEADERALEICVDLGEGGADVGGGITKRRARVKEPRSRSSRKFQERSPSGLRWNPTYHSGYVGEM